jgi:transposase
VNVLRQKSSRGQVDAWLATCQACVGAQHLSRKLQTFGRDARLTPARYVRPYSNDRRNDLRDAEAIAEAVQLPTMKLSYTG